MSLRTKIPSTASVVQRLSGDKLTSPSAKKNLPHIKKLILKFAPNNGDALEIASGTGQHIVELADALPGVTWQPTEIDQARINSIKSWIGEKNIGNLLPPKMLDATDRNWAANYSKKDLILLINLIHLVSHFEAKQIIYGINAALKSGGYSIIYGPFMRNGKLISTGDKEFHQSLQEADSEIGYKNDIWIMEIFKTLDLNLIEKIEMPANNLAFVVKKMDQIAKDSL